MSANSKQHKQKRKQILTTGIMLLFGVLIGAFCGIAFGKYMDAAAAAGTASGSPVFAFVLLIVSIYLSVFLHTVIHEAGHLVFGLLSGYGFSSFRVGSVMLFREDGKLRFKRFSVPGTAGQCLLLPPEPQDGKIPVMLYNFGGVIMNTLFAFMALGLYFSLGDGRPIALVCLVFAVIGLFLAGINGIPMRAGLVDNDGRNAFSIAKDPAAMRAFYLQLKINEQVSANIRLKDMPDEWFSLPKEADMNNAMVATIAVFAANRLMDAHRFEEADALMKKLTEGNNAVPGLYRSSMLCDRLYCEVIRENRPEKIEALLTGEQKKFMRSMKDHVSVLRTGYALAKSGGKGEAQAEAILARFEKRAAKYPYRGEIESERELFALIG